MLLFFVAVRGSIFLPIFFVTYETNLNSAIKWQWINLGICSWEKNSQNEADSIHTCSTFIQT